MTYELWAKDRDTMTYNFIKYIALDNQYYELDNIDSDVFAEAIIIYRLAGQIHCVNYREYENKEIKDRCRLR